MQEQPSGIAERISEFPLRSPEQAPLRVPANPNGLGLALPFSPVRHHAGIAGVTTYLVRFGTPVAQTISV